MIEVTSIENLKDGEKFHIKLGMPLNKGWYDDVYIIINNNSYKLNHKYNDAKNAYFESNISLKTSAIDKYYFKFYLTGEITYLNKNGFCNYHKKEDDYKLSVNFSIPDWAKGKIIYHIFVDRFKRTSKELPIMKNRTIHENWNELPVIGKNINGQWNTDFFGGDLNGIREKLDYLKDLNVSILYLSPIVRSQSNHRYDTADYEQADPYAGTNEDLKNLCDEAHKKGMKIILDGVFNHVGNDSKYFNEFNNFNTVGAYQDPNSYYGKFFKKNNGKFSYWWGFHNLPECDGYSKEWLNYITGKDGIIDKWFDLGIDGLRLDVADELNSLFLEEIRKAVKRNKKDGLIIGEVWKNPMETNRTYISSGKEMDTVMNYYFIDSYLRYFNYGDLKIKDTINKIEEEYPDDTIYSLMNMTSSHDISRAINLFNENDFNEYSEWYWDYNGNIYKKLDKYQKKRALEKYKAYLFGLYMLPGNISIFYGDEIGMEGLGNLLNRKPFDWDHIDNDLLDYFKYLGSIRKKEEFLEKASLKVLDINKRSFSFVREDSIDKALIIINRTDIPFYYDYPKEYNKVYCLNGRPGYLNSYGACMIKR